MDDLLPARILHAQALDRERRVGRMALAAVDGELHAAADHELREVVLVGLGGNAGPDHATATDDRDPIGDVEDLVELVADEDDRGPELLRELAQDDEDLARLLGGEDGGGLVEDEHLRLAVERLEDLDPLLPADRQGADLLIGIDVESEPLAELADATVRGTAVEEDRVRHRLVAEEDVLGDREDRDEHEVLVDHADPAVDGIGRPVDGHRPAAQEDLTLVGLREPVEDVHEG